MVITSLEERDVKSFKIEKNPLLSIKRKTKRNSCLSQIDFSCKFKQKWKFVISVEDNYSYVYVFLPKKSRIICMIGGPA